MEEGVVDVEEDNGIKEDDKENVRKMVWWRKIVLMRMVKSMRILKRRMVRKMVRKRKKIAS